jgi:hypothetical protein
MNPTKESVAVEYCMKIDVTEDSNIYVILEAFETALKILNHHTTAWIHTCRQAAIRN